MLGMSSLPTDYVPYLCAVVSAIPIIYLVRYINQGRTYRNPIRIDGKIAIVTGANAGIGRETATELARRGARVYLACRDRVRGEAARKQIIDETDNPNVFSVVCDLSSFESVRSFAKAFKRQEKHLDILINNAAVMAPAYKRTAEGVELQWATNHFGHWLLTHLLLDLLKVSAPSRIINLTSRSHAQGKFTRNDVNPNEQTYQKWRVYRQTKAANVLFTHELARRLRDTGVTCNCVHPGVANTGIMRHLNQIMTSLVPLQFFYKTPRAAAQNSLYLAVDPELERVSGKYFVDFHAKEAAAHCRDDDLARWLWRESETVTSHGRRR